MPQENYELSIPALLHESRFHVETFARALLVQSGGILILRGPSNRRETTEAVFVGDRFTDFRKLL